MRLSNLAHTTSLAQGKISQTYGSVLVLYGLCKARTYCGKIYSRHLNYFRQWIVNTGSTEHSPHSSRDLSKL